MIKLRRCGMTAVRIVVGTLWVLSIFEVAVSLLSNRAV